MAPSASCAVAMCYSPKIPPVKDTSAAPWRENRGNPCSSRWTSTLGRAPPGQVFHSFDCPAAVPGCHLSIDQRYPHGRIVFLHWCWNKIVGGRCQHLTNLLEMAFAESIRLR